MPKVSGSGLFERRIGQTLTGCLSGLLLLTWGSDCAGNAVLTCGVGPADAAAKNSQSFATLQWSPFGRPETGWAVYEAPIANEIGTGCHADSPGFAAALAAWQTKQHQADTGVLDPDTFTLMKIAWQKRRPFVAASHLACPPAPDETRLSTALPSESYKSKQIHLRPGALAAYRKMGAAARSELFAATADPQLLTIFSGYRSPSYDAARCEREKNCQGVVRATCSAHRTGLAMDLDLGAAPGFMPDSSDDRNRLFLSRSPTYLWLLHNAPRFGFVNYAFEPWHWEWTGEHL